MKWWEDLLIGSAAGIFVSIVILMTAYYSAKRSAAKWEKEAQRKVMDLQQKAYAAGIAAMTQAVIKKKTNPDQQAEGSPEQS